MPLEHANGGNRFEDGHYWAKHFDGTWFIVLRDAPNWYCCGVEHSLSSFSPEKQIVCSCKPPAN